MKEVISNKPSFPECVIKGLLIGSYRTSIMLLLSLTTYTCVIFNMLLFCMPTAHFDLCPPLFYIYYIYPRVLTPTKRSPTPSRRSILRGKLAETIASGRPVRSQAKPSLPVTPACNIGGATPAGRRSRAGGQRHLEAGSPGVIKC